MTNLEKEIIENGIHYTLHGDYYFPDLELPGVPPQAIGHYGRMRLNYLQEHRPGLYTRLILSGTLYEHLAEIDQTSRWQMEQIISQMALTEGVDEILKAKDQMVWVGRMNNIRQCAEEIILAELIYG
ncbi:MAG: TnpV protein [Anaerolineaceae bacterium]|nr:TnpV protein [Anaerolineaceae bacterium]